ncbi:hypothetical protein, partial [Nocardioides sp.]|uniref:NAD(P)/FAD-dependent oxidoreductase n=1 Tax=Nocardioides sp. TaxID=35761 RepID=UPI002B26B85A
DLVARGVHVVGLEQMSPAHLYDGGREGDDDLTAVQSRRHVFDQVLARACDRADLRVVTTPATGVLVDDEATVPTVTGLVLSDGSTVPTDVVVDAAGRRSPVTGWLRDLGIVQPERTDPCIARYYSRHYRVVGEKQPLNVGFADIWGFTCHNQHLFLGDGDTAVVALAAHDRDPVLKALRHEEAFEAILSANPAFDGWREALRPTSTVFCLGAFDNRVRTLVKDEQPLVLGLHQVGDALAITNPTRGRGVSMGLMSAGRLTDALCDHTDPSDRALAFEEWRHRALLPHYRECARSDSVNSAQLRAGLEGRRLPSNVPNVELPEDHPITAEQLERAADLDPDLYRVATRASVMLDDERALESVSVSARVLEVLGEAGPEQPPLERPSTARDLDDRDFLERLLTPYL